MANQNGMLSINSEHKIRAENLPFDIDVWYPSVKDFTFPTQFIPLTRPEGHAVLHYQETRFNNRARLTVDDVAVLRGLEARLDLALQQHFPAAGAFMRLCGRSPKDAEPLDRDAVKAWYQRELDALLAAGEPACANTKLRAIARVSWLRVTSGAEAMSLLLTSERVFTDIHDWLQYGEPEQIVLRSWEPELSLEYEFRAYINKGKLNAISQYDHYTVYPSLPALKPRIQALILDLWERVHPHVGTDSYTMDFAYMPRADRVVMVELSPFLTCTGAALFSWSNTADRSLLENGPLEFRTNNAPDDDEKSGSESGPGSVSGSSSGSDGGESKSADTQRLERAQHKRHSDAQLEQLVEANWEMRWEATVPPYYELYATVQNPAPGPGSESRSGLGAGSGRGLSRIVQSPYFLPVGVAVNAISAGVGLLYGRGSGVTAWLTLMAGAAAWLFTRSVPSLVAQPQPQTQAQAQAQAPIQRHGEGEAAQGSVAPASHPHLIFCYGTLKRGFHWNSKFLGHSGARFIGPARSAAPMPLVVGESGVPYVLGEEDLVGAGERVTGEVWAVDTWALQGLDEYEGVGKGYYSRRPVEVDVELEAEAQEAQEAQPEAKTSSQAKRVRAVADVYVKNQSSAALREGPFLAEYSLDMHRRLYKPITHIRVKQETYLAMDSAPKS